MTGVRLTSNGMIGNISGGSITVSTVGDGTAFSSSAQGVNAGTGSAVINIDGATVNVSGTAGATATGLQTITSGTINYSNNNITTSAVGGGSSTPVGGAGTNNNLGGNTCNDGVNPPDSCPP